MDGGVLVGNSTTATLLPYLPISLYNNGEVKASYIKAAGHDNWFGRERVGQPSSPGRIIKERGLVYILQ